MVKENVDSFVNLPFQYVKQSFEVCELHLLLLVRPPYRGKLQADTLTTPSIVAAYLEELPELSKDGVDEEVIRGVSGTVYLGEHHRCMTI